MRAQLLMLVALVALGCSPTASGSPAVSPSPVASGSPVVPVSPLDGVVVRVESAGLGDVEGFSIRTLDGQTVDFAMGPLENGAQFPPGHLAEHQATSEPVRVYFRVDGDDRVAYRIDDVPES